jgi:pimeloyl-ACP methyl ester carboxylesterase
MRKFLATNLERVPEAESRADGAGAGWRWAINLPVITAALPELERSPLREEERFDGDVLVVTGAKSGYVGPGDWAALSGHFPRARLEVVAGAGHNPHMEKRAEFVRVVRDFLAGA